MKKKIIYMVVIFLSLSINCFAFEKGNYEAAILIEANSGKILYEYNKDKPLPQASITKLMTYYVIMDFLKDKNVELNKSLEINLENIRIESDWSKAGLKNGDKVTLEDLILTMMIPSANDSALQLEKYYNMSQPEGNDFIKAMNAKAQELGMESSKYINTTGLTEEKGYNISSVYDSAILSISLLKEYPQLINVTGIKELIFKGTRLKNSNLLVGKDPRVDGLKTGHTNIAGYCLVATKDLKDKSGNNMPFRLISVVFGCPTEVDRVKESERLLNYGEENFENRIILNQDTVLRYENPYYKGGYIEAGSLEQVYMLADKKQQIEKKIEFNSKLPKKIKKGDEVGTVIITNTNTQETQTKKLYALNDYNSVSFLKRILILLKKVFQ
jgi:serine-type D-Ala-D-Ala carboxypeptidase (penicillin-binding protein 5/6)